MGWDAFSSAEVDWDKKQIVDKNLDSQFEEAAKFVIEKTGSVDGYLRLGALDVSTCGHMLQEATGENCWSETPWSPEFVKKMYREADWDFKIDAKDTDEKAAYWSARKFLEVCAKHDLSIRFSW